MFACLLLFGCFVRSLQFLPSVTELVVAQCYYLDFDDKNRQKPIYVYLNSTGCINEKGQAVSADNEFYAIWAALGFTRAPLYTGRVGVGFCHDYVPRKPAVWQGGVYTAGTACAQAASCRSTLLLLAAGVTWRNNNSLQCCWLRYAPC
jgi:hypothetical protein